MNVLLSTIDGLGTEGASKLGLGGATLLIFAICAVFSLLRGLFRMLIGTVLLCASGYVGYLVWGHFPSFAGWPWVSYAVPGVAGLLVFVVLQKIVGFFTKPFSGDGEGGQRSLMQKLFRMGFSLVPASALWFSGATAVRHFGSVDEIGNYVDSVKQSSPAPQPTFLSETKGLIDRYLPQGWFQKVDPLSDHARINLAKLIALGDTPSPPKAIPIMEEPEIRDLIRNDPKLRQLAREHRYADILRDPRLDHVIANPDLRRTLEGVPL